MNELRSILDDSVNRLFADRLDWDALTHIEEAGFPRALWDEVVEQGFPLVLAAEDAGGMDGGWGDAYPVLRACGRHAVPLPLAEACLCQWLARRAGLTLPEGVPGLVTGSAARDGNRLSLSATRVPWGRDADYLVAIEGGELVIANTTGLEVEREANVGLDPRDRLSGSVEVAEAARLPLPPGALDLLGALLRSAQIAGGAAACLDLAVQYAGEREQFGRPLSKFQAIQHYLADLGGQAASVDAIAMAACEALDRHGLDDAGGAVMTIAAAKCRASDGVEKITRLAHQVHGAIGFTYEYGLHFVTRRLWAWRAEFGGAATWGAELGRLAIEAGGDGIWPTITS